jgi:hypothetical protein
LSPFDLNIDERPTTSQIAPQARNDHDHDGDAARDEFAGMLADRSMNAPRRPPSPASSKGPMSWNEMSSAERQTSLLNDYERPEVDADEQVSPRRRAADAVSSAARTRDPDPSRDARRDALERHTDPRDASATTSETHRDAEVRRGDEARRARDLDPSRPTKVQDRGATSPQTRRTSKARDATPRARVQSQGTASSRSSDGPASAEPTSNARVATVGAPRRDGHARHQRPRRPRIPPDVQRGRHRRSRVSARRRYREGGHQRRPRPLVPCLLPSHDGPNEFHPLEPLSRLLTRPLPRFFSITKRSLYHVRLFLRLRLLHANIHRLRTWRKSGVPHPPGVPRWTPTPP